MVQAVDQVLSDVATVVRGTVPAKPTDVENGARFFGIAEISAGGAGAPRFVDVAETDKRPVVLRAGDVVIALMGNIGQSALVTSRSEGAVLGRECAVIRPSVPDLTGAWIYVWTQSAQFKDQAARHTSGTTMPRLSLKALTALTIPIPPLEHQEGADQLLKEFDTAIVKVDQVKNHLAELRALEVEMLFSDSGGAQ